LKLLELNSFIVLNEDFFNKAPVLILNEWLSVLNRGIVCCPPVKENLRFAIKEKEVNPAIHCECGITQVSLKGQETGIVSGNINCNSFDKP